MACGLARPRRTPGQKRSCEANLALFSRFLDRRCCRTIHRFFGAFSDFHPHAIAQPTERHLPAAKALGLLPPLGVGRVQPMRPEPSVFTRLAVISDCDRVTQCGSPRSLAYDTCGGSSRVLIGPCPEISPRRHQRELGHHAVIDNLQLVAGGELDSIGIRKRGVPVGIPECIGERP